MGMLLQYHKETPKTPEVKKEVKAEIPKETKEVTKDVEIKKRKKEV